MSRPVLVLSALAREQAMLAAAMAGGGSIGVAGLGFRRGHIDGHDVVAGAAGIGKVNAAMVAALAIDRFDPSALVFTGVAGGLDDDLGIGDVVVAERVIHHDAGVLEPDGFTVYQAGHVPFFNPTDRLGYRPSDDFLGRVRGVVDKGQLAPVLGRRPAVVFGTVVTGDQYVHAENVRRRLHATFAARAVEMEGAAVAQVAEHFGVDWLVVRAVSDRAGGGASLDFNRFLDEVAANSVLVVRQVLSAL